MAAKRSGLGKGLDSLIPNKSVAAPEKEKQETVVKTKTVVVKESDGNPLIVNIAKVEPNREQPRKKFEEDRLQELADSIRQFGVITPLLVQKKDDYYEIIAGERRWRAAKIAELKEVPVIVKEFSSQEMMEVSLIENIQREDLNPIEEALAYKRLIDEFHMKQDELADRVSKSRTAVTNSMRLLKLDEKVQQMVIDEMITNGHARTLIPIEDQKLQYEVAQQVFDQKLSVRETERLVKNLLEPKNPREKKKIDPALDAIYRDLEEQIKKIIGTKVTINSKNEKSGKVEIEYYSKDDLEKIIDILRGN